MRARWSWFPLLLAVLVMAPTALAAGKDKAEKKADKKEAAEAPSKSADGVRRDPKGVTGISPYAEAVNKGNAAYVTKDWDKASEAYREAIGLDDAKPEGHYLLGQAQLAAGKLDEADKAWQAALKASSSHGGMQAKVLFVIADLRERQGKFDDAATAWKAYGSFVSAHPKANGYEATATDRDKVIGTRKELAAKYGEVKKRIETRQQEVQAQGQKK